MLARFYIDILVLLVCALSIGCTLPTNKNEDKNQKKSNDILLISRTQENDNMTNQTVGSKPGSCSITIEKSATLKILQILTNPALNIVDLRLYVAPEKEMRLFAEKEWVWTNLLGREILSIGSTASIGIDMDAIETLRVGRSRMDIGVYDSPKGCVRASNKTDQLIAKALLKDLFHDDIIGRNQICYAKKLEIGDGVFEKYYVCCQKVVVADSTIDSECHLNSDSLEYVVQNFRKLIWCLFIPMITSLIASLLFNTSQKSNYYTITESPMSPSSIFAKLCWDEYGRIISFVRRFMVVAIVCLIAAHHLTGVCRVPVIMSSYAVLFCSLSPDHQDSSNLVQIILKLILRFPHILIMKCTEDFNCEEYFANPNVNYQGLVGILTLPFNFKLWRGVYLKYKRKVKSFYSRLLFPVWLSVIFVLLFFYCCNTILMFFFITSVTLVRATARDFRMNCTFLSRKVVAWLALFHAFCVVLPLGLLFYLSMYYIYTVFLFSFVGIVLNATFFVPYITFLLVLILYSWKFWKLLEKKYFTLKWQIYEICKESGQGNDISNNDSIDGNGSPDSDVRPDDGGSPRDSISPDDGSPDLSNSVIGGNEGNLGNNSIETPLKYQDNEPVISKLLYDQVREKLLPYHIELFHFSLKVICVFCFACFVFSVVQILQPTNISSAVKAITTIGVSAVPFVFYLLAGEMSDEQKKARYEVEREKVKKLVLE